METKHLNATIDAKSVKDSGEFTAILSMPTLDRDHEVVVSKALEPLPERITIDIDHGLSVASTVGSGVPYYDGDVLKVKGRFASTPLGQEVRTLVTEGHIGHMSVAMGFTQKETRSDGITYITKGTLLNAAIVGIPANMDAAILTAKSHAPDALVDIIKTAVRDVLAEQAETTVDTKSPNTEPPVDTAAPEAAVTTGAQVDVARALAAIAAAEAELAL